MLRQSLEGKQFGNWSVIEYAGGRKWHCKCSCGNEKDVDAYSLTSGKSLSCGCLRKKLNSLNKVTDLTGEHFGDWTVISYEGSSMWKCQCSCGKIKNVKAQSLKEGTSTSCGHATTGFKDLTGKQFGELTAIKFCGNSIWECKCSCGRITRVGGYELQNGKSKSCGKHKVSNKIIDLKGKKFGDLTVLEYVGGKKWKCQCSCGNIIIRYSSHIRNSNNQSCGCKLTQPLSYDEILYSINTYIATFGEKPYRDDLVNILGRAHTSVQRYIEKYNLYEYINTAFRSKAERDIGELIKCSEHSNRKILQGTELDLVREDLKIAVEYNGYYWHSSLFKDRMYHLNKTKQCSNAGYRLIHIFEYEWNDPIKQDIISNLLLRVTGQSNPNRIYARNCKIYDIDSQTAYDFEDKFHLSGHAKSKVNLGCYFNNELIGVMTFGAPRFDSKYEYELIRLCWDHNYEVVGGASKLFSYFKSKYNPKSIVSYCDIAKFTGRVYEKMGFRLADNPITDPNYVWVNRYEVLTRYKTQKAQLVKLGLGSEDQTEDDIMSNRGYFKVYDCGNIKFEWLIQ